MKKVKPVKTFLWSRKFPTFKKDEVYDLEDDHAKQMVELGYAKFAKGKKDKVEEKVEGKTEEKMNKVEGKENKMMDLNAKDNKENLSQDEEKEEKKPKKGKKAK